LTDSTGTITDTYKYDAFGNLLERTESTQNNYQFTGEGLFLATLRGSRTVYLQSLPFSRLADRIIANVLSQGGQRQDEG